MQFTEIQKYLSVFNQFDFEIPKYYFEIPDEVLFTSEDLADYFNMSISSGRRWFNPGLNHGPLISQHISRGIIQGKNLKEWLWIKDYKKFVKNKNFEAAMKMIQSKVL